MEASLLVTLSSLSLSISEIWIEVRYDSVPYSSHVLVVITAGVQLIVCAPLFVNPSEMDFSIEVLSESMLVSVVVIAVVAVVESRA